MSTVAVHVRDSSISEGNEYTEDLMIGDNIINDEHEPPDPEIHEEILQKMSIQNYQIIRKDDAKEASAVNLLDKLHGGGAISIDICGWYKIRIYIHYMIWQIPFVFINILLFSIWLTTDMTDISSGIGFFAVGTVLMSALIRDRIFRWSIYYLVKKAVCCSNYGRYHLSRIADCIGGLHSSLGVTALIWNSIYARNMFFIQNKEWNVISGTALGLPLLLFLICISATPCLRYYYHNSFEIIHRYLNWFAVLLLVIHIGFVNDKHSFLDSPTIFAIILVVLTVYPWIVIHRIKGKNVEIIPSTSGVSTAFIFPIRSPMGAVCKISLNWTEFHVMGITPLPYDKNKGGHRSLVLIKSLGDWSHSLIRKSLISIGSVHSIQHGLKTKSFWIHRIKSPNFSRGLFNWNRVFLLATGAGIAPLLPYVINTGYYDTLQISLLWVARNHELNYPQFIIDILRPLPNVILWDTTKQKRPNLPLLTMEKVEEFDAEAVFIVSNPKVAYAVANYVNKKGVPVFASNFDV